MPSLNSFYDGLTQKGAPFELASETVLGENMRVLVNRPRSLAEMLVASEQHDEREFLISGDQRITFAEHRELVYGFARALQHKYGVGPGDRVAILGANSVEWIVAFWAITSLGAIAVGLNGWWSAREIVDGLADCEPKLIVGDRKRLSRLADESISIPVIEIETDFDALSTCRREFQPAAISEDDPACILYTSGTTGRAKGAVLSHRSLIASVGLQTLNGAAMFIVSGSKTPPPAPCTLLTTPLFHVSGLIAGVVMMLSVGAKVVLRDGRFDPIDVMRLIEREGVTSWSTTPTMAHRVVNHPELSKFDLSSLRNLGSGGSALSEALQNTIRERLPSCANGVGLGYGLTESGGIATINSGEELASRPTSAGRAMPCVSVQIRDASGSALVEAEEGEIYIQSPLVMLGYWRNDVATEEALAPGRWLRTGDVGHLEDGHLYINSRARDLILRGGENVYPTEIEHVLEAHPQVDEAAVVGQDHEELGQEVVAFVVPKDGATLEVEDLRGWAAERLAGFKVPVHWRMQQTPLPRNATGKLLKPQLMGELSNTLIEE